MSNIQVNNLVKASFEEEQLYLIWSKIASKELYTETWSFKLMFECGVESFKNALEIIFKENDILKSNFIFKGDNVYKYLNQFVPEIKVHYLLQSEIDDYIDECKKYEFDLNNDNLMHFHILIDYKNGTKYLLINHHHILSDSQTKNLILNRLIEILDSNDSILKKHKSLTHEKKEPKLPFDRNYLENLHTIQHRLKPHKNPQKHFTGYTFNKVLSKNKYEKIQDYCKNKKISLYTFFLTTFYYTTLHISGEEKFRLGTPFSTRNTKEDFSKMGYYVNLIPFYLQEKIYGENYTWTDRFKLVQKEIFRNFKYKDIPYKNFTPQTKDPLNGSQNVVFSFQETSLSQSKMFTEFNINQAGAKFEFTTNIKILGEKVYFEFEFSDEIFNESESKYFIECFMGIIESALAEMPFYEKGLMTRLKKGSQIVHNSNEDIYSKLSNLAYEKKYENKLAIVNANHHIKYRELLELVDSYILNLSKYDLSATETVALEMERGIQTIAMMVALAKLKVPFVHLNKNYPKERVDYILEDINAKYIITDNHSNQFVKFYNFIDDLLISNRINNENYISKKIEKTENCFEVFYTSGTTGLPKGVKISQDNILNFTMNFKEYGLSDNDIFTHCSTLSFDAANLEIWMPLLNGCTVIVIPEPITDIKNWDFKNFDIKPTIVFLTTSMFHSMVETETIKIFNGIKSIFIGGEKVQKKYLKKVMGLLEDISIINGYGPTENTTYTTTFKFSDRLLNTVPIGRPGVNVGIGIVNKRNMLLPEYCEGEIIITGENLSSGYLNENSSNNNFIFTEEIPDKIYKTGDIGYISKNSILNFISRVDSQIKLRGYRIELTEIEENLLNNEMISTCVIEIFENMLVLVYEGQINPEQVRTYLKSILPTYMMPNKILHVNKIPLTVNGKLDKSFIFGLDIYSDDKASLSNEDRIVKEVIKDSMGIQQAIGIDTNLFELGIDSIKSMQICSKLRSEGYSISMNEFSECSNIRELGKVLSEKNRITSIDNYRKWKSNKLSPIQKWFFNKQKKDISHWNQSVLLKCNKDYNFEKILKQLVDIHPILKSRFIKSGDDYEQIIDSRHSVIDFNEVKNAQEFENLLSDNQLKLDIFEYVYKCNIIYFRDEVFMHFVIHHLVVDGVSWRIILDDLSNLLKGNVVTKHGSANFRDWVNYMNDYEDEITEKYYSNLVEYNDEKTCTYKELGHYNISLTNEESNTITNFSKAKTTGDIETTMLSIISQSLYDNNVINKNSILLMEGHGRPKDKNEFFRTVGWFTNLYPFKLELSDDLKSTISLLNINQKNIPIKGIGFQRYYDLNFSHDWSFNFMGEMTFDQYESFDIVNIFAKDDFSPNSQALSNLHVDVFFNNQEMNINISYHPTYYKFQDFVNIEKTINNILSELKDIEPIELFPTNQTQNAMIMDHYKNPMNGNYIIQWESKTQNLKLDNIVYAIDKFYSMIEAVRISFIEIDGEWYQKVHSYEDIALNQLIRVYDFTHQENEKSLINRLLKNQRTKGFNIEEAPLIRFLIIKVSNGYKVILENHHLILDGWSMSKIFTYFNLLYKQEDYDIKELKLLKSRLINNSQIKNLSDFNNIFEDYEQLTLPKISNEGLYTKIIEMRKDDNHLKFLEDNNLTANQFYLTLWSLTLKYLFGREDILFAITTSGRTNFNNEEIDSVGMFVSTLPFRINLHEKCSIKSNILPKVKKNMNKILENDSITWRDLIIDTGSDNEIQIGYVYENYPKESDDGVFSFETSKGYEQIEFPLALSVTEYNNSYKLEIKADGEYISKDMCKSCENLLYDIYELINTKIDNIEEISENLYSKTQIFPSRGLEVNNYQELSEVLDYQFNKYKHKNFISNENKNYTYGEAYEIIKSIINRSELTTNDIAVVITEDRTKMTFYALACFFAGATYIPITKEINNDRLKWIINNSSANCVFYENGDFSRIDTKNVNTHNELAYIIYTSGSTGKPKGVKVSRKNLSNLLLTLSYENFASDSDVWYQNISMSFDPSIFDILMPIMHGATIYIPNGRVYGSDLEKIIYNEKITIITMTPSLAENLEIPLNSNLRLVNIGGEKLTRDIIKKFPENIEIINMYGPTEATIISNFYRINVKNKDDYFAYPIGKPINSLFGYAVSPYKKILPYGVAGEYVLEGTTISQGYTISELNKNFNIGKSINTLYTGDLVSVQFDSNVQYVNRLDNQIKLRGFRIELGEIESILKKIMGDNEFKLIFSDQKDLILCYTLEETESYIRNYLEQNLPSYSIPNFIRYFKNFPITKNGKLDVKEIEKVVKRVEETSNLTKSNNESINEFLNICSEVLCVGTINQEDNFFSVGGDSLKGMNLVRTLKSRYDSELKIKDLFKSNNFGEIYSLLKGGV